MKQLNSTYIIALPERVSSDQNPSNRAHNIWLIYTYNEIRHFPTHLVAIK
jgi:hypothetical protein